MPRKRPFAPLIPAWAFLAGATALDPGCGARSSLPEGNQASDSGGDCSASAPRCVAAGIGCEAPNLVEPSCDVASHRWQCPAGTVVYTRAPAISDLCLPFRHAQGIVRISGWGYHSFSRVPTDDGRCLWIAGSVTFADGTTASNVAFQPNPLAPFGSCPADSLTAPAPAVTVEGGADPSLQVQITGSYRLAGTTRVLYRLFKIDPTATFGVTEISGGIGRYDSASRQIVIPSPSLPPPWNLDLDLGDAVYEPPDAAFTYVWGCAQSGPSLEEGCNLARIDASNSIELLAPGNTWIRSTNAVEGQVVFTSGTWLSSVVSFQNTFRHVYIVGFGTDLRRHAASAIEGPWSAAAGLGPCALPPGDSHAFCAGPVVHDEISDPTQPGEMPITYNVGTTSTLSASFDDYWPRLIWVK